MTSLTVSGRVAQAARALENGRTLVLASIIRSLGDLSALQDWIDAGEGYVRGRLPNHVKRPGSVAERMDASL